MFFFRLVIVFRLVRAFDSVRHTCPQLKPAPKLLGALLERSKHCAVHPLADSYFDGVGSHSGKTTIDTILLLATAIQRVVDVTLGEWHCHVDLSQPGLVLERGRHDHAVDGRLSGADFPVLFENVQCHRDRVGDPRRHVEERAEGVFNADRRQGERPLDDVGPSNNRTVWTLTWTCANKKY